MFRSIGAGYFTSFVLGILPLAFPDLVSYTFYRLECAFRTAAVFGFVGIETIGYRIKLSSDEFHLSRSVDLSLCLIFYGSNH